MKSHNLLPYPEVLIDPAGDFEATRHYFGKGSCIYNTKHYVAQSGETVVYIWQQREGDEPVFNEGKYIGNKCLHGIIVAGYLVKPSGIFSFFKRNKVRVVNDEDRESLEAEIMHAESQKVPADIEFWR
ncbi:MAG TPA: hypothetical protein VJK03_04780 [Candidatus Nanoarchaeia archaeon]|nr:hypothetical protein [Candidatus Nanoarchaeia archaeon]